MIALARILMPASYVRLSAGRTDMSDEMQALCFFAGANSIFYGERLLTTPNPAADRDQALLARLGLRPEQVPAALVDCSVTPGADMTGPDRHAVARAFRRAAAGYARADFLHAEIRARLLERLDFVRLEPQAILDLGAGPPEATTALARRFPGSRLLALDLVPEMLGTAPQGWSRLCADAARLPLPDASVDLVSAGMLLHWCADPAAVLAEARRVLRYPGLFLFSTLGPGHAAGNCAPPGLGRTRTATRSPSLTCTTSAMLWSTPVSPSRC